MAASPKPGFAPTEETHFAGLAILLHILLKYALHFLPRPTTSLCCGIAGRWRAHGLRTPEEIVQTAVRLAEVSILTAIALREYLVATIVVRMLSGGQGEYAGAAHAQHGTSQRSEGISPT